MGRRPTRATTGRWVAVAMVCATAAAGAVLMGACTQDEPLAEQPWCPNRLPEAEAPCQAGLECNYVNPASCPPLIVARCGADGRWELDIESMMTAILTEGFEV